MNIISTVQVWTRGPQRPCLPGTEQTEVTCVQEGSSDRVTGVWWGTGHRLPFMLLKFPLYIFPVPSGGLCWQFLQSPTAHLLSLAWMMLFWAVLCKEVKGERSFALKASPLWRPLHLGPVLNAVRVQLA